MRFLCVQCNPDWFCRLELPGEMVTAPKRCPYGYTRRGLSDKSDWYESFGDESEAPPPKSVAEVLQGVHERVKWGTEVVRRIERLEKRADAGEAGLETLLRAVEIVQGNAAKPSDDITAMTVKEFEALRERVARLEMVEDRQFGMDRTMQEFDGRLKKLEMQQLPVFDHSPHEDLEVDPVEAVWRPGLPKEPCYAVITTRCGKMWTLPEACQFVATPNRSLEGQSLRDGRPLYLEPEWVKHIVLPDWGDA